jgi:hypothetical protein
MWKAALAALQQATAWWKGYPHPWPSANPGSGPTNPAKKWGNRASATVSGVAACEGSPFVFGQSAPDSGVLTGLNSPFQAGLNHLHRPQTAFASSVRRRAGPLCPIGKNNSGSTPRQAARSRQVIRIVLLAWRSGGASRESTRDMNGGVTGSLKANISVTVKVTAKSTDESDEGPTVTVDPTEWWAAQVLRGGQLLLGRRSNSSATTWCRRVLAQVWELAAGGLAAKDAARKTNAEWPLVPQGPTVRIWTQATGCSHSPRR